MSYVIVRNAVGGPVCFGPDDGMYEPVLAEGETLEIVEELPSDFMEWLAGLEAARVAAEDAARAVKEAALAKLEALGLTADDLKALGLLSEGTPR